MEKINLVESSSKPEDIGILNEMLKLGTILTVPNNKQSELLLKSYVFARETAPV